MKSAVFLMGALPLLACAQIANRVAPSSAALPGPTPTVTNVRVARIPLSAFVALERTFDGKLASIPASDHKEPIDLLGATRGLYLNGYGVVFTTEMGLILTPTVNPFNRTITEDQKARVHSAKISRLAVLKQMMAESLRDMAGTLAQVPDTEQVVLAVRLDYLNWENTAGLPGLVVARADRRSAMAGNIQIEEQ